jgi:hypothetical protein
MGYKFLGAHVNSSGGNSPDLIAQWKPPLVTLIDHSDVWHSVKAETPKTIFVGRVVTEQQLDFNDPGMFVSTEVDKYMARILPVATAMGDTIDYWQGENEPILNSVDAMMRYSDFELQRAYALAEGGFKVALGSFGVGHPTKFCYWTYFLDALSAGADLGGVLALHEYGWPTLDTNAEWLLLRHRKVYKGNDQPEDEWGGLPPTLRLPLVITEGGLDGLLSGPEPRGWRVLYGENLPEYHRQLAWYDDELGKDEYVTGVSLYAYDCGGDWETYDHMPDMGAEIAENATPVYRLHSPQPYVHCTDVEPPQPMELGPITPPWLPDEVSGRPVSNRGVHLLPFGHHTHWMTQVDYWMELFVDMGLSWVVLITEGDSVLQEVNGESPIRALLSNGIIPIIRDKVKFPRRFKNMATVGRTVEIYGEYGLKPPWILYNEPFDEREWETDQPPYEEAWTIIADRWMSGAGIVVRLGGVVGFPDGPCFPDNPFERIIDARGLFDDGLAFYTGHHYGKGRPIDYPYDTVSQFGYEACEPNTGLWLPLTPERYSKYLDDYAEDPKWREESVKQINDKRFDLVEFGKTAIDDDTCWRGWEKVAMWSEESLGYVVPMAMTEGGWVPRDRAGTGPNTDIRWPHTTPNKVGVKTLEMFDEISPFFAICPWLVADDAMNPGYTGWPFDAWVGWAYNEKYGWEKPVVHVLKANPPTVFVGNPTEPDPDPDPDPGPDPCPDVSKTMGKLVKTHEKTSSAIEELKDLG